MRIVRRARESKSGCFDVLNKMLRINQIKIDACDDVNSLSGHISKIIEVPATEIKEIIVLRESIDARKGKGVFRVYNVLVRLATDELEKRVGGRLRTQIVAGPPGSWKPPDLSVSPPPGDVAVVGAGPAGLFGAYILGSYGFKVKILERGREVKERVKSLSRFWRKGELDSECNLQFGEGGAGTFSDGKLTTRIKAPEREFVIKTFSRLGGGIELAKSGKPHIGTDRLMKVIPALRKELEDLGVEILFGSKVTGLVSQRGTLKALRLVDGQVLPVCNALFAPGHSARDTFHLLAEGGVLLENKPFAVGVRVEHPQQIIDEIQYGSYARCGCLEAAYYRSAVTTSRGRGVYTFCMCPGGTVVLASSEGGDLPVNGMSPSRRETGYGNSGIVVQVGPSDYGNELFGGVELQRSLEEALFDLTERNYLLPSSSLMHFLGKARNNVLSMGSFGGVGRVPVDLDPIFPENLLSDLKEGICLMGRKMKGFLCTDANVYAVESRTSSPLRILRGPDFESISMKGLYPAGEGSGYAGGIVSSAVDGIRSALSIVRKYSRE